MVGIGEMMENTTRAGDQVCGMAFRRIRETVAFVEGSSAGDDLNSE